MMMDLGPKSLGERNVNFFLIFLFVFFFAILAWAPAHSVQPKFVIIMIAIRELQPTALRVN